eukprot:5522129-Amphidinium_carterae.1
MLVGVLFLHDHAAGAAAMRRKSTSRACQYRARRCCPCRMTIPKSCMCVLVTLTLLHRFVVPTSLDVKVYACLAALCLGRCECIQQRLKAQSIKGHSEREVNIAAVA